MASFTVKMMAGSLPPVTGSNAKSPAAASVKPPTLPLQVKINKLQKVETRDKTSTNKTSTNISRRDLALFLTATSLSAVTLSSPKPAEAGIRGTEIKKMILEKFKILREKVGLSNPKSEEKEKITSPIAPSITDKKIPPSKEEKNVHVLSEPSLPSIQNDKKIAVEAATLP